MSISYYLQELRRNIKINKIDKGAPGDKHLHRDTQIEKNK
jgi:hypothetical protein